MSQTITIRNPRLAATIATQGAELLSLIPAAGQETIWSGDPAVWAWHAPNLFPIVGALVDDRLIHLGQSYPMKQHGFLRHSECQPARLEADGCDLRLEHSAAGLAQYPFDFELTISYRLDEDRLSVGFALHNPAETVLYASLGAHPGFRWPLLGALEREQHIVRFDQPEPANIRRLRGRTLDPQTYPTPVEGQILRLNDALFDADAVIFDHPLSRCLTYGVPGSAAIELSFPDFPSLGIWSKPGGAPFICLEPWQGFASPEGAALEFADKPGVIAVAAGTTRTWRYAIRPILEWDAGDVAGAT
jgi:galactose mutarotase-like enzyme